MTKDWVGEGKGGWAWCDFTREVWEGGGRGKKGLVGLGGGKEGEIKKRERERTVPAEALNMPILPAVASQLSAGTMAFRISVVMSHSFSCSAPKRTTTRLDWELKEEGTCWRASLTISWILAGVTVRSLERG
jgi:hypothetical protein